MLPCKTLTEEGKEKMINVAIVENEKEPAERLIKCLNRFTEENGAQFKTVVFTGGKQFLQDYKGEFDVVFMDVDMPGINGFETARSLRNTDNNVVLIFVTNLSRYAIRGYEYDATDYVIKPLEYSKFAKKIKKIVALCNRNKERKNVRINTSEGLLLVDPYNIQYVEIMRHSIIYHTLNGQYYGYGTMKKVEECLPKDMFFRCNNCYLVNLKHVKRLDGFEVTVGEDTVTISHPKKKSFVEALHIYYKDLN